MLTKTLTRSVNRLNYRQLLELRNVCYRLELVLCGKKCGGCPHGPYWYAYYRSGGRVVSKYIGKEFKFVAS